MPRLTMGTFLMYKASGGSEYTKLVDITEYPDLNAVPEQIDVTTLSDWMHKYIPGLEDSGGQMEFSTYLSAADMTKVSALANEEQDLSIWIGGTKSGDTITPTGSILKRDFKGYVTYVLTGAGVDEAAPATIVVMNSSAYTDTIGTD